MQSLEMPSDYALVLQQVDETGQEDFTSLSEGLSIERRRLSHILHALQHKGLVIVSRSTYSEGWIRLSAKGHRLTRHLWPDSALRPSF